MCNCFLGPDQPVLACWGDNDLQDRLKKEFYGSVPKDFLSESEMSFRYVSVGKSWRVFFFGGGWLNI